MVGEGCTRATLAQQRQALAWWKSAALQARAYALGESGLGDWWLLAQRGALDAATAAETAALEAQQAQTRCCWTRTAYGTPRARADAEH